MTGSGRELVPTKRHIGAPKGSGSKYTEEVADEICERMSLGCTLIRIVREDRAGNLRLKGEFPSSTVIYDWASPEQATFVPSFALRFARAKLEQQRYWLEETVDIANTPVEFVEETKEWGGKDGAKIKRVYKDNTAHRMLQIKTRLDVIARMNPLLWSERLQLLAAQTPPEDPDAASNKLIIEGGLPDAPPPEEHPAPETETEGND
jgi:hypothetical protein